MANAIGISVLLSAALLLPAAGQTYSSTAAAKTPELTVGERADIFLAERDYSQAVSLLQQTLRDKNMRTAPLYNRLAIAYQQLNNLGKAEKYYKQAIKKDKKSGRYRNNLGTVYYMKRKWNDAGKQFREAIRLDPTKATYYVNLGGVLFARKKYRLAIAAFRVALRIDPDSLFPMSSGGPVVQDVEGANTARFHYDLARLFCSMGMVQEAVHEFSQAYDMHYKDLKASLTDPIFAPLRKRPEYRTLMGLPPLPPPLPSKGGADAGPVSMAGRSALAAAS
ncbi:MAG: tetratricopeptide repeat protein [Terriglobales bacterium]